MNPLRDIVLIKADPAETKTESGLLLHENWKTLPLEGTVLEVGPEVTAVKRHDRVVFARYGSVILPDDERLVKEKHIIGVLDEGA